PLYSAAASLAVLETRAAAMSMTGKSLLIGTASTATQSGRRGSDRLDLDQPLRRDQRLYDDGRRAGAGIAEMLCPRCAGCGHVFRPHQVSGDLHQVPDLHSGVRENGDNV